MSNCQLAYSGLKREQLLTSSRRKRLPVPWPPCWILSASMVTKNKSSQSNFGRARRSRTNRNKVPPDYNGTSQIHNCLFPFDDNYPYLIHPSLDRPHSPPQTASESIQQFCHNTLSGHTDTQADRWDRRQVYSNNASALLIVSDALIMVLKMTFLDFPKYRTVATGYR